MFPLDGAGLLRRAVSGPGRHRLQIADGHERRVGYLHVGQLLDDHPDHRYFKAISHQTSALFTSYDCRSHSETGSGCIVSRATATRFFLR